MEKLLDQADALLLTAGENGPERSNFEIPEELMHLTAPHDSMQVLENPNKGKGWFAKLPLAAGTILLVAKPVAWALDCEWDGGVPDEELVDEASMEEDSEHPAEPQDSQINELLVLEVLQTIKETPSIWHEEVSHLYPRDAVDIQASPVWISKDDDIFSQFEAMIKDLESIPGLSGRSKEISQRLPLIIRYNVLSVETCPELLSYPGPTGHSGLAGVGLYHLPSFFNHDPRPNASRYAVGDIMWFVANQDIPAGHEVCISYLEHDILCENVNRRNDMLTLDFKEDEDANGPAMTAADDNGPEMPVVDSEVQNELMGMTPFERLEAIDQLIQQAAGEALPEGEGVQEDGMDAHGSEWFQCDLQNLRILKAITLDGMGQTDKALAIWEECVQFTENSMPPHDESSIVMRVQAALCAWNVKDEARAKQHATVALHVHNLTFGGGVSRFHRRYLKEFCLNLRADSAGDAGKPVQDVLWPYQG
jgi:hypothetical protein